MSPAVNSDWQQVVLADAVEFLDGQRRPVRVGDRAKMRGDIPYYGASGIVDYVNQYLFDEELILLGEDGENILSRVVPLAFKISGKAWVNNHAHVLRPREGFDIDVLSAYLESLDYSGLNSGTAQPKLNKQSCAGVRVVQPPLLEQRAIAAALRDSDDLIGILERLVAKKQAIMQGMMQELLTGRRRLPGFTGEWAMAPLGEIAVVTMGQSPAGSTYNTDGVGLPLVQGNADIRDRRTCDRVWTSQPTKRCRAGEVLLTVRAPVGLTAVVSKDACLGRGVCSLTCEGSNRFLFHALVHAEPRWKIFEQGSTFTSVNSNEVRGFVVSWPSSRAERAAIAEALDDADLEISMLRRRLTKAKHVKEGMMQALLTGRTRLKVAEGAA